MLKGNKKKYIVSRGKKTSESDKDFEIIRWGIYKNYD